MTNQGGRNCNCCMVLESEQIFATQTHINPGVSMPPVISFIGWHNSGKTTLTSQVVAQLKDRGYTVAVIKSTKETGIEIDQPQTDTAAYRKVGADSVALLAPCLL